MNIFKTLLTFSTFFYFISCSGPQTETKVEATEPAAAQGATGDGTTFTLQPDQSVINWMGSNAFTPKRHEGTLQLAEGSFTVANNQVTGGKFVADMNTISSEGDEYTDGAKKVGNLIGHLKSDDFFNVEVFPTATFEVTSTKPLDGTNGFNHEITGNLTIKGITKQITFPANVNVADNNLTATAAFMIDRSQWEVKYGSESFFPDLVKDRLIRNEIELKLNLAATAG